jgi:hypothetical protein
LAPHIASRGATFSIEWLVRAKRAGYRFVELPVTHRPRVAGSQTGANIDVITRAFKELMQFRLPLWRGNGAQQAPQDGPRFRWPALWCSVAIVGLCWR